MKRFRSRPILALWAAFAAALVVLASLGAGCSYEPDSEGEPEPTAESQEALVTSVSLVESEQWRAVPITAIPTAGTCTAACVSQLNQDDGNYLQWLACSNGANTSTEYGNPTDLQFAVPDHASIGDATLTLDAYGSGSNANVSITCVNGAGATLGTILPTRTFSTSPAVTSWDVPLSCFAGPVVTVRLTRSGPSCLGVDFARLNVRSSHRRVPIASIPSAGTCGPSCVDALNKDDGSYLQWIACSNGNNTATEYGTPTDLRFTVPDYASVTSAAFDVDAFASGSDARMRISCIDGAGASLATLFTSVTPYSTSPQVYRYTMPLACFAGPTVTIRIERLGSNCLGADFAALSIASTARPVPIASIPSAGTCTGTCVDALNQDDGSYLQWIACSNGYNTTTEYGTPTDFRFSVPDYGSMVRATVAMDVYASGSDARMTVTCVDGGGATLGTISSSATPFSQTAQTYVWSVPTSCFTGPTVTVRVTRDGSNCLGADFVRLYTTSAVPRQLVLNQDGLEGYSDKMSVSPGQTISFKVHSPQPTFSIDFQRLGSPTTSVLSVTGLAGQKQHYPPDAYRAGAGWATSYTLTVPSTWKSGMYVAHLYDGAGGSFDVTFVVRSLDPGAPGKLLVLASTNTWTAYNAWGGASYYGYSIPDISGRITANYTTMDRPNPAARPFSDVGHLADGEQHLLRWLENNGYAYSMLADTDVHSTPGALSGYGAVIISTHSEYWSSEMYDALVAYLNAGGHVLYLSGNGVYWKVTLSGRTMECRKDSTVHTQTGQLGGLWRDLGRPEAAVLGVAYDGRSYPTSAPFQITAASHWALEGTNLANGDLVGKTGLNLNGGGASGWEMDGVVPGVTPANRVILAQGTNASLGADMLYYDHPGGGGVFSAGSINYGGALVMNAHLTRITMNVLGHFGVQPAVTGSHHLVPVDAIPTAGSCTGACVNSLNRSDGSYLQWLACSNGLNTATEYDNPTDLRFSVPDAAAVTSAALELDAFGSGSDARVQITCVNGAGATLATILAPTLFSTTASVRRYPVPLACFTSSTATIRLQRTGSNCLGVDYAGLEIVTGGARASVATIPTPGTCTSACVSRLNSDDGDYVQWLACSNGYNTSTEYDNPTTLEIPVSGWSTVTSAALEVDAFGSGSDARIGVRCVDSAGTTLATILPATLFSQTAKTYRWNVPVACFTGPTTRIRFDRTGSNCLGVDSAKLFPVNP